MPSAADAAAAGPAPTTPLRSAGAMLKAAREREGLHLAVLAATIKVTPAKLEALEQDRHADLPNLTFTRALAQSVCRSLKIDPRPVLALLPQFETAPLENAMGKLNTPFQERASRDGGNGLNWASKPMFLAGGALLLAAIVVGMVPPDWFDGWTWQQASQATPASSPVAASMAAGTASAVVALPARTGAAIEAASAAAAASTVAELAAAPAAVAAPPAAALSPMAAAASAPVLAAAGLLQLAASAASWIEVVDASGLPVFSRVVKPGESVSVDGRTPLRVQVGNAGGTTLIFRGQVTDLAPYTRNNVARLELR